MAECTRCGSDMGDTIRYAQMVDENRNWAVRTEQMKPICEKCAGEIMAFAHTPISPRRKSGTSSDGKKTPGQTSKPASEDQEI